jgi:hypothetical protein
MTTAAVPESMTVHLIHDCLERAASGNDEVSAALSPEIIASLRSREEIAKWNHAGLGEGESFDFQDTDLLGGEGCAAFTARKSGERWPYVELLLDKPESFNWSLHDVLSFEVHNPGEDAIALDVLATNRWARGGCFEWPQDERAPAWDSSCRIFIPPGRTTMRVPVDEAARTPEEVRIFRFMLETPQKDLVIYLADVRLESIRPSLLVSVAKEKLECLSRSIEDRDSASLQALATDCSSLQQELLHLDRLAGAIGDSPDCRRDLLPFRHALTLWHRHLCEVEERLPIASFNFKFRERKWGYGITHSLDKVFRTGVPFQGTLGGVVELALAKNETGSSQVVLRSRESITGVTVSASNLVSESGEEIPRARITCHPVGYVNTNPSYYKVDRSGWWPDPICTYLDSFALDAEVWQPVWVDISIPAGQKGGVYSGEIVVSAAGLEDLRVPVRLRVLDFAIPVERHFENAFHFHQFDETLAAAQEGDAPSPFLNGPFNGPYRRDAKEWDKYTAYCRDEIGFGELGNGEARRNAEIMLQTVDMMLEHRINPDFFYHSYLPRIDLIKKLAKEGVSKVTVLNYGDQIHKPGFLDPETGLMNPETKSLLLDRLERRMTLLKEHGLDHMARVYGFDEAPEKFHAALSDITALMKERHPGIEIATTAYDSSYGLDGGCDSVDVWCPLVPRFETNAGNVSRARGAGKRLWWYVCLHPRRPFPNFLIEYSAAEARLLMGIMPHKFQADGFLYYCVNMWGRTVPTTDDSGVRTLKYTAEHRRMNDGPLTSFNGASFLCYNGDGLLIYPGEKGTIPTIRLKSIRDGLYDYEYIRMLKQLMDQVGRNEFTAPAGWLEQAQALLDHDPELVDDLRHFDRSGRHVLDFRSRIASALQAIHSGENS